MSDNIIKKIFNSSFSQQMNIDMDLLQAKYEMKFETLKIDTHQTLSAVFSGAQGSQKGAKMGATMEGQGTQNRKKSTKTRTRK